MVSIVMFDCIHIVAPLEFFYYLVPAVVLTLFYNWNKNVVASMLLHSSINVVGYVALLSGLLWLKDDKNIIMKYKKINPTEIDALWELQKLYKAEICEIRRRN